MYIFERKMLSSFLLMERERTRQTDANPCLITCCCGRIFISCVITITAPNLKGSNLTWSYIMFNNENHFNILLVLKLNPE
jgi:hypothetical protein